MAEKGKRAIPLCERECSARQGALTPDVSGKLAGYRPIAKAHKKGRTIAAASSTAPAIKGEGSGATVEGASKLGQLVADRAKAVGVTKVVFDRGGFAYHGRIAAVGAAAREAGLQF